MRLRTMPVALLAVAGLVAGCGGSTTTATHPSTPPAPSSSPPATSGAATTTPGATPSFASTQNCQQLVNLGSKYVNEVRAATSGGTLNLAAAVKADQALADASPPAIHSDAELVVHTFSNFSTTLAKVGYTPGATPKASQILAIVSAARNLSTPQFQAAIQHISAWVTQNCSGVSH